VSVSANADQVSLEVGNGGEVIDPDEAARLTEPFRRLERGTGGFGLGLSIVRSVAEAHGGSIEVIAPRNGGLRVRVRIPATAAPAHAGAPGVQGLLTKS
jgi:signal transduction histidine kinase